MSLILPRDCVDCHSINHLLYASRNNSGATWFHFYTSMNDREVRKFRAEDIMGRKYRLEFFVLLLLSYIVSNATRAQGLPVNGVAYVPYSHNIPKIDGLWTTPQEWTDATMIKVEHTSTGWTFYLGLKYNGTHIFVLLDFVSDKTPSTHDFGGVFFDTKDDGGNLAGQDDFGFVITPGPPVLTSIFQGTRNGNTTGEAWTEIFIRPYDELYEGGFSGVNDPYESEAHRIMEFAISRQWFNEVEIHYGFYAFVSDRHSGIPWPNSTRTLVEWPMDAGGKNIEYEIWAQEVPPAPKRWGDIVFYEDINALYTTYIGLNNNFIKLENNYAALLENDTSLQSAFNQLESNYDSLSKSFNELQTAYFHTTYLLYSLLAITIILATLIVYLTKSHQKRTNFASKAV